MFSRLFTFPSLSLAGLAIVLCLSAATASASELSTEEMEFFENRIRPILVESCYDCHSVESGKQKGGLLLDSRQAWQKGGDSGAALVPGDLEASILIDAIRRTENQVDAMPPKTALSEEDVATLEQWITMGAPDPREATSDQSLVEEFNLEQRKEEHWCWRPVNQPSPPETELKGWARNEIDAFILAELEQAGIRPANDADKRTWLRRVTLDLTGLPPSVEEIDAYLKDESKVAAEKVVDRLLESPAFGEKWARHWMDLVRYAETYGHEFDYPIRFAWEYRDYLVRAFNEDVPWNQFIREHVAGDLLETPRVHPEEEFNESIIGTGFWYLHEATHAPTDVLTNEADIMSNQIDVFSKAFQSLTISCARCHDHKFDAISTKDYYALTGYLHSSARQDYPLDPGGRISTAAEQLKTIQGGQNKALTKALAEASEELDPGPYLAAATTLFREQLQAPAATANPEVVFEDFEAGYGDWELTGTAFGEEPAKGAFGRQQAVTGFRGKGLVNSYNGSDRKVGTLLSPAFTLEQPFINFVIGGGNHKNTVMELRVDGKIVRTASGSNRETLEPASWSVDDLKGKTARIQIVDKNKGGWGHINVDHITFGKTDEARVGDLPSLEDGVVRSYAISKDLNPDVLLRWTGLLGNSTADDSSTGSLLRWIRDGAHARQVQKKIAAHESGWDTVREDSISLGDFGGEGWPEGWSSSGEAFTHTGSQSGIGWNGETPFTRAETIDGAALGREQHGILRSPTFEITHPNVHLRLKSEKVIVRLVIDNYQMQRFQPLLFRGTILNDKETDTGGEFRWKTLGNQLDKYVGHRAYLEIIDEGDGYAILNEILMSPLPAPAPAPSVMARMLAGEETTIEAAAEAISASWKSATSGNPSLEQTELLNWLHRENLLQVSDFSENVAAQHAKGKAILADLPAPRYVVAMADGTPEPAQVYIRGGHNNLGDEVPLRYLEALGSPQGDRLDLAKHVADEENPLTARSIVNRLWHHLFGSGIVATVDDFGPMGTEPTHPELLDWLAADFMEDGWSIKNSIRTIVLSSTYRQSSLAHPSVSPGTLAEKDPNNRLLYHMPVRRLPAESIRDSILAVSGNLNQEDAGGPSYPVHLTNFMSGRGKPKQSGPMDGNGRRTIYGEIRRNFLSPFMLTFDMPQPFGPKGRRSQSNVPAQSLAMMNDPFVRTQAEAWASELLEEELSADERIHLMMEAALGRRAHENEMVAFKGYLADVESEPQAWADLAHVVLNMKEFIYLN